MRAAIPVVARFLGARGGAIVGWLAIICILAWFQGRAVLTSFEHTFSGPRINGDAQQQIFPFFRYFEPASFTSDYIADYYLACYPLGYFWLYASAAKLGIDPTVVSRVLPHLTWLTAVVCVGAVAHRFGGKLAALLAMALALGSNVYLARTSGGLPRGFGFPILGATLVALAYGRVFWCAGCVLLGALFYPITAVIAGFSLACLLLFPRLAGLPRERWPFGRRLGVLTGTAALAVALLAPTMISSRRFGDVVRPTDVHEFPEAGKGGRYDANSRPPFKRFFAAVAGAMDGVFVSGTPAWSRPARVWLGGRASQRRATLTTILLLSMLAGGAILLVRRPAARRILMLGVACGFGYTLARAVAPYAYLPDRYVAYSVPLVATVVVATAMAGLFPASFRAGWWRLLRCTAIGGYTVVLLWLLGGRVGPDTGLAVNITRWKALHKRIAALPPNALVAGWPRGPLDRIPYGARRSVLVSEEVHQAFHKGFVLEMRRRTVGLIDAYFATSVEPILSLRDDLGVTHLLVDRSHFAGTPPKYFKPFDKVIARRLRAAEGKPFELPRRISQASVYTFRDLELLDLSKIVSAPVPETEPAPRERRRRHAR